MVCLTNIATVEKLTLAAQELNPSKKPDFDGKTAYQLRLELDKAGFAQLTIESLIHDSFIPGPLLEKKFPKPNSDKMRTIYVPCVLDKAIQVMLVAGLTPTIEARFHLSLAEFSIHPDFRSLDIS